MKFKFKDAALIHDYLSTIKTVETVLWEGKMGKPLKYLENYNSGCLFEILFSFFFFVLIYNVSNDDNFDLLFLFSIPCLIGLIKYHQTIKIKKLDLAKKHTQYIITNKRVIFILYKDNQIHIESIPFSNIEKVHSSKQSDDTANIYLSTIQPVSFQTFKYWSQKPHQQLVMVQVEASEKALSIIQSHLL